MEHLAAALPRAANMGLHTTEHDHVMIGIRVVVLRCKGQVKKYRIMIGSGVGIDALGSPICA
jgi:hypothetical protein